MVINNIYISTDTLPFDLNLIPSFIAVAESGKISSASHSLHLTQPAVSLQIKKLEGEMGEKLFDRSNRGLVLTPFGKIFLTQSRMLLKNIEAFESLKSDFNETPRGQLKIGTYSTASSYLIPEIVKKYLSKFPEVKISYSYDPSDVILDKVEAFDLDCAILSEVPSEKNLEVHSFFIDELILVTSNKNLKNSITISPKELMSFSYLSYPHRYENCYRKVDQYFGKYLRQSKVVLESDNFETLKRSLLEGIGVSFIPRYIIKEELKNRLLSKISISKKKIPIEFSFVSKKDQLLSKATNECRTYFTE